MSSTEMRPFRVEMSDEAIADLRRRIAAMRWPSKELVDDRSQGVQLAARTNRAPSISTRHRPRQPGHQA